VVSDILERYRLNHLELMKSPHVPQGDERL
jgi:hypothetical protein